ncbi:uncharacterized protein LOC143523027 [Brachyhypopomus gauderio]|uniref:uncharacterized protein LOC143523027 n=1 Tax=Brachyhypopomus gauderio TaxID=698409 RepID=UPI004042579C
MDYTDRRRNRGDEFSEQIKRNDERFRSIMEGIFQKYSGLDDQGPDVCFNTMTFRTGEGSVPIYSVEADREMRRVWSRVKGQRPPLDTSVVLASAKDEYDLSGQEMDETHGAENELDFSTDNQNCSLTGPHASAWIEMSQPEEEDQDLERTLSSHGNTLLDVYPSMLDQIGKVCQRQRVMDVASTVLQKYRRQSCQPTRPRGRNRGVHSRTLNKENSIAVQQPLHSNGDCHHNRWSSDQADSARGSMPELFPYKSIPNSPSSSTGFFYSPRRDGAEQHVEVQKGSPHKPVHVIDLLTSPSSSPTSSPSSDLNQTYDIEQVAMQTPHGVLASPFCGPAQTKWNSPQKEAKSPLLIGRGGRPEISSPTSCSRRQPEQECANGFVGRERFRNSSCSPATSLQRTLVGRSLSVGRSPLRPRIRSLEREQQTPSFMCSPKQTLPVNDWDVFSVCHSPYRNQQEMLSSPHPACQQDVTMAPDHQISPRPPYRRRSLSGHQPVSSVSHMSRRGQIDAEFRRIYHHFICRGSSSYPTFCHLCQSQLDDGVQGRSLPSSSWSALAPTPPWHRLKKRCRQPEEEEESLRFKRFRESYSPRSKNQQLWLKHQQANRYICDSMENTSEDKRTWNRALLLQCPSPGLLRASERTRKVPGSKHGLLTHQHSPSWRDTLRPVEATSPMRSWNQSGVSQSPSMSRRRLLYGPLQ